MHFPQLNAVVHDHAYFPFAKLDLVCYVIFSLFFYLSVRKDDNEQDVSTECDNSSFNQQSYDDYFDPDCQVFMYV